MVIPFWCVGQRSWNMKLETFIDFPTTTHTRSPTPLKNVLINWINKFIHVCIIRAAKWMVNFFYGYSLVCFCFPPIFIYMRFIIGLTECRAIFGTAPHQIEKIFRAANEINLAPFETMKWVRKKKVRKIKQMSDSCRRRHSRAHVPWCASSCAYF